MTRTQLEDKDRTQTQTWRNFLDEGEGDDKERDEEQQTRKDLSPVKIPETIKN